MVARDEISDDETVIDYHRGSILRGVGCSVAFHAIIILAILASLHLSPDRRPNPPPIILADLVQLGDTTTSPQTAAKAQVPQQQATERAHIPTPAAIPTPGAEPSASAPHAATLSSTPQSAASHFKSAKAGDVPQPRDDLSARLEQLAQLQQPDPHLRPSPRDQQGPGQSNISAANNNASFGSDATYRVKDFLRVQIERRWYVELGALSASQAKVSIHILIDPDGTVRSAEVIDNPRYRNNGAYQEFAQSARNAVLLSSPLTLLPGSYAIAKDIVIDFDVSHLMR